MALPSGWIYCDVDAIEHSGEFTLRVRAVDRDVFLSVSSQAGLFVLGLDRSGSAVSCGDWGSRDTVSLWAYDFAEEDYASRHTLETESGACPQPYLSTLVTYSLTALKLVAGYVTSGGLTYLTYRLWQDEDSTRTLTVGDRTITTPGPTGGAFLTTPSVAVVSYAAAVGFTPTPLADGIQVANIAWNGEADPTTSDDLAMVGAVSPPSFFPVATLTTRPPLKYTADVRVEDAGGTTRALPVAAGNPAGAGVTVTNPGTGAANVWRWYADATSSFVRAVLSGDWTRWGITPQDLGVPLRRIVPKRPDTAPESWTPATLSIASPVPVLLSTNVWSGSGSVALSGTGNRTWTVTGAATVTRLLAGTYDSADGYTTTKHAAGEDVWGWGLYAKLSVQITADVASTLTLTLYYVTNEGTGATTTRTYTVATINGTTTVEIDLPFPIEGGPDYWERVSKIEFTDFDAGVYTLDALSLVANADAYVKHAPTGGWPGLTLAVEGSFPAYWWGPNPILSGSVREKDDETGYDGSTTEFGGGVRMDGTLESVTEELDRMEGVTVTYDDSAIAADLTDGTEVFGNLTTYPATWYHDAMGARVAAGDPLDLDASMRFDRADLCPAPAGTFVLPFRGTLGMVLEALCVDDAGARAGAGFPMVARRSASGTPAGTDPVIGSGVTDASGFVSVPIPTGLVAGAAFYAYLTAG